jgi:CHASE3 domain sensor protein
MFRSLTLGQQIAAGVLLPFLFMLLTLSPYSYSINVATVESNRRIAQTQTLLFAASECLSAATQAEAAAKSYALSGREDHLTSYRVMPAFVDRKLEALRQLLPTSRELQSRMTAIEQSIREAQRELAELTEARRSQGLVPAAQLINAGRGDRATGELQKLITALSAAETEQLQKASAEFASSSVKTILIPILCIPFCIGIMVTAVLVIIRNLNRQIGTAIQHLRNSATELQAAATQQAKGAKGQAGTATEVATTMRELVSTSRQIADSAQRVTGISTETTSAARAGDHTMQGAQTAIHQIKHQVDRIVAHMLDLGKRSQEIGGILDIINELAEQTNILAINATIEAAGAGDAGRRFAVVADEIRKLADRVGSSTKEIRSLIEEVRAAANTTVMVTEDGSKAVDNSSRQFSEVATSFGRIVELVSNTTQASREIELSTRQQTTAVEQVSSAITEVAQTARETEASSAQTLQTAAQLADLSQKLVRLVRRAAQE